MRPTTQLSSGMPTGKAYIGWWGDMGGPKQKGVYSYTMSPVRQKAFYGVLHGYLFNGVRRLSKQLPYFGIPMAIGYYVYTYGRDRYAYQNSKHGHHEIAMAEGGH